MTYHRINCMFTKGLVVIQQLVKCHGEIISCIAGCSSTGSTISNNLIFKLGTQAAAGISGEIGSEFQVLCEIDISINPSTEHIPLKDIFIQPCFINSVATSKGR